jgi:hypothetical protein
LALVDVRVRQEQLPLMVVVVVKVVDPILALFVLESICTLMEAAEAPEVELLAP